MKKKHFKLIELEHCQVMLERGSDDDNGEHVAISTYLMDSGIRASYTLGFGDDEAKAVKCIEEFDEEWARKTVAGMEEMLTNPS